MKTSRILPTLRPAPPPSISPVDSAKAPATLDWKNPREVDAFNDDVLYLGMGVGAPYEARKLKEKVAVTAITDALEPDRVKLGDRTYDLMNDADLVDYVSTFGLPEDQTAKVLEAIRMLEYDARDEAAQLARVMAGAERGETIPSRLVLSGHSMGEGLWGDENGYLRLNFLYALTAAMPTAARAFEDVHFAGCYMGGQYSMDELRAIFPRVKTIWAYEGSAPGAYVGAVTHLHLWEAATRGDVSVLSRDTAAGTYKAEYVSTWSETDGLQSPTPKRDLAWIEYDLQNYETYFRDYFTGLAEVENPQSGTLRDYYNLLHEYRQHPDLPESRMAWVNGRRNQTLRALFYKSHIAPRFQETHAAVIDAGFNALGVNPPNFSTLTRTEALTQIAHFRLLASTFAPKPKEVRKLLPLLEGLATLNAKVIPETWV